MPCWLQHFEAYRTEIMVWHVKFRVLGRVTAQVSHPALGDLGVWQARHNFVQELAELRIEALIVEVDQEVSCRMANVKDAHVVPSCSQSVESARKISLYRVAVYSFL
jgi:hypothetical protein